MDTGEQKTCIHWYVACDSQWTELGIPLRKQESYYTHLTLNETGLDVVQLVERLHSMHKVLDSTSSII